MRVEDVDLDDGKKQVISDLSQKYDVQVIVLSGWVRRLTRPIHKGAVYINLPFKKPFIVLSLPFLQNVSEKAVEFVTLHEIGHKVLYEMDHEEFAEKFALKEFSGTMEDYKEFWASFIYFDKTGEPLEDVDVGDEFL